MTKRSTYKGNPTIKLACETQYPFEFGLVKARLILAALPEIQAFVKDHEKPVQTGRQEDYECTERGYEERCERAISNRGQF